MTLSNKAITFKFYYKDQKELNAIMKSINKFMPKVFFVIEEMT